MASSSKKPKNRQVLHDAARLWGCPPSQVQYFDKEDPLNHNKHVAGYICKHEGKFGGSLLIVSVGGETLSKPQHIFGTPKLAYPYTSVSDHSYDLPLKAHKAFFANKWNGMNVLVYKYIDSKGDVYVSMKSKGVPFLHDGPFGNFLSLSKEVLKWSDQTSNPLELPKLSMLKDPNVQSITFELCGKKEPHLVLYDFDIHLEPLFLTDFEGRITPIVGVSKHPSETEVMDYDKQKIEDLCRKFQIIDEEANDAFRKKHGLTIKYEFGHFLLEGRVLYVMDEKGHILDRTMYKIKPSSIEETHWSTFDINMQARVREVLEKIAERDIEFNQTNVQKELDMGPKEWSRFGVPVWKYANRLRSMGKSLPTIKNDKRRLLILVGLHGSGKTTLAKELEKRGWTIAGQDRSAESTIEAEMERLFMSPNAKVLIDSMNLIPSKRRPWIEMAKNHGVLKIDAVYFDISESVLNPRLEGSGYDPEELQKHRKKISKTTPIEGFSSETIVTDSTDMQEIIDKFSQPI